MDNKEQIRLISGISIIVFGSLASLFLGLGIALTNPTLTYIGGILMGTVPLAIAIISKWLI